MNRYQATRSDLKIYVQDHMTSSGLSHVQHNPCRPIDLIPTDTILEYHAVAWKIR